MTNNEVKLETQEEKSLWIEVFLMRMKKPQPINREDAENPDIKAMIEADNAVLGLKKRATTGFPKSGIITRDDIVEFDIFSESLKQAKEMILLLDRIEASFKKLLNQ